MKNMNKMLATLLIAISLYSCNSGDSNNDVSRKDAGTGIDSNSSMTANDGMSDVSDWPERPSLAAKEMTVKYGSPPEVSLESMVWHNAGPYKRILVT